MGYREIKFTVRINEQEIMGSLSWRLKNWLDKSLKNLVGWA